MDSGKAQFFELSGQRLQLLLEDVVWHVLYF
jgi:hypothetical protein